jgi:hypothetical protein
VSSDEALPVRLIKRLNRTWTELQDSYAGLPTHSSWSRGSPLSGR